MTVHRYMIPFNSYYDFAARHEVRHWLSDNADVGRGLCKQFRSYHDYDIVMHIMHYDVTKSGVDAMAVLMSVQVYANSSTPVMTVHRDVTKSGLIQ